MHHVFELDEILRIIAKNLTDTGRSGLQGALSLACCCKPFSAPVLDTMWEEEQTDFVVLLKTFPQSVWEITDHTFHFVHQPSEEEWKRLSIYARRMRTLSDILYPHVRLSEMALKLLNARFSGGCVLPRLRRIMWYLPDPEMRIALIMPLVVSPHLTTFYLVLQDTSQSQRVISALAPAYGSLRSISIFQRDSEIVQDFSTLLLKCNPNQLLDFCVGSPLSWSTFLYASQLPNLQYFSIRAGEKEPLGEASLPTTMFPSLKSLSIKELDTDSIWLRSLTRIRSESLESLGLELKNAAAARTGLPATLSYLRSRGFHRTLTKLIISPRGDFGGLEVDGTVIEPLLSFNQLTTLAISFVCDQDQCGHKLSDEDLEKLVKAMPKLKVLALGKSRCSRPANNSIKSLVAIAKHCKHLENLSIHTNVEAVIAGPFGRDDCPGEDPALGDPALAGCPLNSIVFNPCFIPRGQQGIMAFSSTLLRLFPHLVWVKTFGAVPQWSLVTNTVRTLRRVRVNTAEADADMGVGWLL